MRFAAAAFLLVSASAQSITDPPLLIRLIHTAGGNADPARVYADTSATANVLGLTAISGPAGIWLLEMDASFAAIESVDKTIGGLLPGTSLQQPVAAADDELLPSSRAAIAIYRPSLSYRAEQGIRTLARSRYVQISMRRVRAGSDEELTESIRTSRHALNSINADLPMFAYQVVTGAPAATYLFVTPLASLSTLDDALARLASAYKDTAGDALGRAMTRSLASETARETALFRIDPRLSYVSADFAAGDPDFWTPAPSQ